MRQKEHKHLKRRHNASDDIKRIGLGTVKRVHRLRLSIAVLGLSVAVLGLSIALLLLIGAQRSAAISAVDVVDLVLCSTFGTEHKYISLI